MAGDGLAEVQRLSEEHSAQRMKPRHRRTAARLLRGREAPNDGWLIALPTGDLRLVFRRSFSSSGRWSQGVELFELMREEGKPPEGYIRKTLVPADQDDSNWLTEALFYLDAAPRIECPGLTVPKLYGCAAENEKAILVIEYVPGDSQDWAPRDFCLKAASLAGKFGALCRATGLHQLPWLRQEMPVLDLSVLGALEALSSACFYDREKRSSVLSAIEALIGDPQLVSGLRSETYECLLHNDFQLRNVIPRDTEMNGLAVIDWGKTCRGPLGHDAVHLLLPAFLRAPEWSATADFSEAVDVTAAAFVAGAHEADQALDVARIRLGLDLGLIFQIAVLAGKRGETWIERDALAEESPLKGRIASMLDYAAHTAVRLKRSYAG